MPKHEKKKKKRDRHVLDLNELKELAKAHRHKADKKKKTEDSISKAAMVPQTKADHDKEQNIVRKVVDPLTGRTRSPLRLVKGSGEIIEEVVSKDKQREINRMATLKDGLSYEAAHLSGRYAP
ncbi:hypothetical protein K450DRAFT_303530 [Umbelopsis ramanniana AG]|uniref:ADP-ribosylation factor-like protein 6-interacting protein 4 n=1 Tax=Umbelopsis ramanniana AG TaxID=1314678 RepID=A0AAD5E264_UMBRA|nr:uncharacterized protein K450DRAFT_303530 [Umbelopsis ramanniana AG]KAI8575479.1 hypothetical protein K450DRAFT_303530 [Umbelopsis ramanniana AG]